MKKPETTRIVVTLPDDVHLALKRLSAVEDVPMAALIRYALISWMQQQGVRVSDDVVWGGSRYTPAAREEVEDDTPGQWMAETAR